MRTFLITCLTSVAAFAESTVSDVALAQDAGSGKVTVTYALSGDPAIVTVDVRTNGVSIGAKHLQYVWGCEPDHKAGCRSFHRMGREARLARA